jgi:hypothetical protein
MFQPHAPLAGSIVAAAKAVGKSRGYLYSLIKRGYVPVYEDGTRARTIIFAELLDGIRKAAEAMPGTDCDSMVTPAGTIMQKRRPGRPKGAPNKKKK